MLRRMMMVGTTAILLAQAGCCSPCKQRCGLFSRWRCPPAADCPPPSPSPPRFVPSGPGGPPPAGATIVPPGGQPPPGAIIVPPGGTPPQSRGSFFPPTNQNPIWRAGAPDPMPPGPPADQPAPRDGARLLPPMSVEPPSSPEPPIAKDPEPRKPGVKEEPEPVPSLPVDIPQFAITKSKVAIGLRPFPFNDGVTWLKARGYKAVLHVRPPGGADADDRAAFTAKGIDYFSLPLSDTTLTKDVVLRFNEFVADPRNIPLFVYDKDGALAGALWYVHFRTVEKLPDTEALAEAKRLGLRPDDTQGEHYNMLLAAKKYLADNAP